MDKLIFGMSQVKFCGLEIGWFDEQGVTPAGTAATQVDIYAAQVKAENLVNTIGGSKDDQGNWEPPEKWEKTGVMDIVCDSGHTIRLYKAKVTGNDFGGGVNSQGVLSVQLNIEVMKDENGKRMKIFAPGIDPETGKPKPSEEA